MTPSPRSDVIQLKRGWYRPDGRAWDGGTLQTGDMLVVWVQASSNQNIPDALLVDRVPAGFEVENMNLSQSPEMQEWTIGGVRVADAMSIPTSSTANSAMTGMWRRWRWAEARWTCSTWCAS